MPIAYHGQARSASLVRGHVLEHLEHVVRQYLIVLSKSIQIL